MARFLREILRNPSPSSSSARFISTFSHQNPSNFSPPLFLTPSLIGQLKFDHGGECNTLNPSNVGLLEEISHLGKLRVYPNCLYGFSGNPILPCGSGLSQLVGPGLERPGMIWADSVKRKRKKKINKHKLKKRRKLLRRKTRKS